MEKDINNLPNEASEDTSPPSKKPFKTPKLTYLPPKLTKQGKVEQVTQSFFGSFSP